MFLTCWYNFIGLICLYRGSFQQVGSLKASVIHGIVCLVNSFCSLLYAIDMDVLQFDGKSIKYLRYVEWTICSTLMLLEMMISSKLTSTQMTPLLVLTLAFCMCGTIAALSALIWVKLLMAVQGTFYCVIVLLRLWRVVLEKHIPKDIDINVAIVNLMMATAIWPMYILTWGLGPDVFAVISDRQETLAELIASVILKTVGMTYAFVSASERVETCVDFMASITFVCQFRLR